MSRSRKKAPVFKEHGDRKAKRAAARRARRILGLSSGASYKKVFQSWDICDWRWWDANSTPKDKGRRK